MSEPILDPSGFDGVWRMYLPKSQTRDPVTGESLRPNDFRKVHARVGEPIAFVREIYVDPRTMFRLTRHPDGSAQYGLMSRLSDDGGRIVGSVQSAESDAAIVKHMIRDTGPPPVWPA